MNSFQNKQDRFTEGCSGVKFYKYCTELSTAIPLGTYWAPSHYIDFMSRAALGVGSRDGRFLDFRARRYREAPLALTQLDALDT